MGLPKSNHSGQTAALTGTCAVYVTCFPSLLFFLPFHAFLSFHPFDPAFILLLLLSWAVPHPLSLWTPASSSGAWTVGQSHWFVRWGGTGEVAR